jgi:hypothetical protein
VWKIDEIEMIDLNVEGVDSRLNFQLFSLLLTLSQKNLLLVIFQCYVCLFEELFVSHCFYNRVKNKCGGRILDMLPNLNQLFFLNN